MSVESIKAEVKQSIDNAVSSGLKLTEVRMMGGQLDIHDKATGEFLKAFEIKPHGKPEAFVKRVQKWAASTGYHVVSATGCYGNPVIMIG